jgi:hypothetical protein
MFGHPSTPSPGQLHHLGSVCLGDGLPKRQPLDEGCFFGTIFEDCKRRLQFEWLGGSLWED